VKFLGIRKGTSLSAYTQLYVVFFISGIFHTASILLMPYPTNITFYQRTMGIMSYFMWQAIAITIEDLMQWWWKTTFGSPKTNNIFINTLGYIWVVCSFWVSLPWAGDVMIKIRMGETSPFPFTFFKPLVNYIPLR